MSKKDLTLENFLTEKEVLDFLGVTKEVLANWRSQRGLPCVRITKTSRLYLDSDLIDWLYQRRTKEGVEID